MTIPAGNKYAGRLTLDLDIGAKVELNYFNIISKSKTGSESVSELVLEREADQNGAICCNVQVRRRTNFGDEEFQENFAHDYTRKLMMYTGPSLDIECFVTRMGIEVLLADGMMSITQLAQLVDGETMSKGLQITCVAGPVSILYTVSLEENQKRHCRL